MAKPKILSLFKERSLQQCFPQMNIMGRAQSIFIECQSYDLIIQVRSAETNELDIFEDAVLRMIQLQVGSAEKLAEDLCLPVDLVSLIIMRLQEKEYLNDQHTLSPKGESFLGKESKQKTKPTPLKAKLFRIPRTGQILPYIHIGEFQPVDIVDDSKGFTLEFGSRGEPKTVRGRYLRCDSGPAKRLSQWECMKAIKLYNRLAHEYAFPQISVLENWAIDCTPGERVYLHMQAAIQMGNIEFPLISDGFVPNVDELIDYLDKADKELLPYVRKNALELQQSGGTGPSEERHYTKYREIHRKLDAIKEMGLQSEANGDSITRDQILLENQQKQDLIRDCSVMLEWSFFYYAAENPISSQLRQELNRGTETSNAEIIIALARKLGVSDAGSFRGLFSRVNAANMLRLEKTKVPDFYICFPLALAQAGESRGGNLQKLIEKSPNLLSFLDELFKVYRGLRHSGPNEIAFLDTDRIREQSLDCIFTLFPELQETAEGRPASGGSSSIDISSSRRLAAYVSMEQGMGSMCFNSLPNHVQDDWMRISPNKSAEQLPDPYNYVNTLYRLLEGCVCDFVNNKNDYPKELSLNEGIRIASDKWGEKLPATLCAVAERYFSAVQRDRKVPLGAYVLYGLCLANEKEIETLKELDFVNCVDTILALRRHGNDVALCVDAPILSNLRDQIMRFTKYLGGFIDEFNRI